MKADIQTRAHVEIQNGNSCIGLFPNITILHSSKKHFRDDYKSLGLLKLTPGSKLESANGFDHAKHKISFHNR